MRLFNIFKPKPEPTAEKEALANLDEVTREVSSAELDKNIGLDPLSQRAGAMVPPPVDDPDPIDSRGLKDVPDEEDKPERT